MSFTDPLGDMLTRIRNGQQANMKAVTSPWSKLRESVCTLLKAEGYIRDFSVTDLGSNKKEMTIELKYAEGRGVIRELKRVSKPGRRVYYGVKDMPRTYSGLGVTIVSTPRGVMSDQEARSLNVGGEVLCQIF